MFVLYFIAGLANPPRTLHCLCVASSRHHYATGIHNLYLRSALAYLSAAARQSLSIRMRACFARILRASKRQQHNNP